MGSVRREEKSESDVGVGLTLEVRLHRFKKMYVESREKIVGWVTRRGGSGCDGGVGVTLEVKLDRFMKC